MHFTVAIPVLVMLAQVATSLPSQKSNVAAPNGLDALKARGWSDWADSDDKKRSVDKRDGWNDWADSDKKRSIEAPAERRDGWNDWADSDN